MRFSLIKQLFIVSLCTLLLPWAGCQYVKEMETLIRQQQSNTLAAFTKPIAQTLQQQSFLPNHNNTPTTTNTLLFAPFSSIPVTIDGYADDWVIYYQRQIPGQHKSHKLRSKVDQQFLYLFLEIQDANITYYDATQNSLSDHDWVQISTPTQQYRIFTAAPGSVQVVNITANSDFEIDESNQADSEYYAQQAIAAALKARNRDIIGNWQENRNGYQVELKIPLTLLQQGLKIDIADSQTQQAAFISRSSNRITPLLTASDDLQQWLKPFSNNPWELQIITPQGWPLVTQPDANDTDYEGRIITRDNLGKLILNRLYRFFLQATLPQGYNQQWPLPNVNLASSRQRIAIEKLLPKPLQSNVFQQWYALPASNQSILLVIEPVYRQQQLLGYVVATQLEDALLSFTNDALRTVMNISLLTFITVVSILMGYAFWLSLRIRRLQQATRQASKEDGSITLFAIDKTQDELGALSKDYVHLLQRIKNYNDYLQSLTHKLAHEIRTPLAIVKSSLEMLASATPEQQATYIERALQGNQRLANMLNAMSESTQVEQFVQQAERAEIDLTVLLKDLHQAYQSTYPDYNFVLELPDTSCKIDGNPDLLAQLIDKLVDNARDFSPKGTQILLRLKAHTEHCTLEVFNPGSRLPEQMTEQLFDSLISIRQPQSPAATTHLGLGLYIVRLIAQAHGGTVSAKNERHSMKEANNQNTSGVCFSIKLPLISS